MWFEFLEHYSDNCEPNYNKTDIKNYNKIDRYCWTKKMSYKICYSCRHVLYCRCQKKTCEHQMQRTQNNDMKMWTYCYNTVCVQHTVLTIDLLFYFLCSRCHGSHVIVVNVIIKSCFAPYDWPLRVHMLRDGGWVQCIWMIHLTIRWKFAWLVCRCRDFLDLEPWA